MSSEKEKAKKEFLEWAQLEFQRCYEILVARSGRSGLQKMVPAQVVAIMEVKRLRAEDCDSDVDWDDDLLDHINYALIYKYLSKLERDRIRDEKLGGVND